MESQSGTGQIRSFCGACFQRNLISTVYFEVTFVGKEKTWVGRCKECGWRPESEFLLKWWALAPEKEEVDGGTTNDARDL